MFFILLWAKKARFYFLFFFKFKYKEFVPFVYESIPMSTYSDLDI